MNVKMNVETYEYEGLYTYETFYSETSSEAR